MNCKENCNCTIFHKDVLEEVEQAMYEKTELDNISDIFKIIGDPTRLMILHAIEFHELCVCDLGHLVGVTKSAISHQMKLLKKYGLVKGRKVGKMVYYSVIDDNVKNLIHAGYNHVKGASL
ncbi:Transcriptional regulator, ArsR family [Alteracholeplasma palmae J233]|uniref:Transcriptional regulator, ArsR family n=1 Tax=Alteracholeplasma palmae (strain ATCC 49389 / J233) TaxID=1318466 RepID=U4KL36_ALTPJ|nr:metalloregulator ArsR/SmtB family transcription factor [Alteracholeplasma palmae]CCV64462.1 Transcriptional regulator, ArsR family [Alteracholeplasma palmae J233]